MKQLFYKAFFSAIVLFRKEKHAKKHNKTQKQLSLYCKFIANMGNATIILDKRRKLATGEYPIKIRIVSGNSSAYISTKYKVFEEHFSTSDLISRKAKNIENIVRVNNELIGIVKKIEAIFDSIPNNAIVPAAKKIKDRYFSRSENEEVFFSYFKNFIAQKRKRNERTAQLYEITLKHIAKFEPEITDFAAVNLAFVRNFESFLLQNGGVNNASINLRNLRALYNSAIDDDVASLANYPFRKFKIAKQETDKRNLTVAEIKAIRDVELTGVPALARDVFMLIFYLVGINLKDLCYCKPPVDGRISYYRAKTGRKYTIKVEDEAKLLIQKYAGNGRLIDILSRYKNYDSIRKEINKKLKVVAKIAKVEKDISTYYARHSWATIAYNEAKITKDDIATALGHGGKTVTDIYINEDLAKIDEANRKVIDILK